MKALITIILTSLVFTSCSSSVERDQYQSHRVLVPTTGVTLVRTIDTLLRKGDTVMVRQELNKANSPMIKVVVQ